MIVLSLVLAAALGQGAEPSPLSPEGRAALEASLDSTIRTQTDRIKADPSDIEAYSRRGDARFMRGRFREAVEDYEKTVALDPSRGPGHWQRGIAYFYAGFFEKAAGQFEAYRSQDDVDRENGIWRYFSQLKAYGKKKARAGLLKYAKDDREPFPDVYRLFEGRLEPREIIERIEAAPIAEEPRRMRLFYAHLYIGLNFAVEQRTDLALEHLRKAVENPWARGAGYGPSYMWQVGRVEYLRLSEAAKK